MTGGIGRAGCGMLAGVLLAGPGSLTAQATAAWTGTVVAPTRRVEHGIETLTFPPGALQRAARLAVDPAPVGTFGGSSGDPAFDLSHVDGVALLSNGGLATFQMDDNVVLIFGPDGRGVKRLGGAGQGPGQFVTGKLLRLAGDTLLVIDDGNARATWIVPARGVIATTSLNGRLPPLVGRPAGKLANGDLVLTSAGITESHVGPPGTKSFPQPNAQVVVLPRAGTGVTVASVPDVELGAIAVSASSPVVSARVRFSPEPQVVVWNNFIVTGAARSYAFELRDGSGRTVQTIAVGLPRRPVTSALRAADLALRLSQSYGGRPARDDPKRAALIEATPFADSIPAYSGLFVSPNQTLWVVDGETPFDSGWSATGFRPDGAIVGRISYVGPGRPVGFGDRSVLLRTVDADDVVALELHRLRLASVH